MGISLIEIEGKDAIKILNIQGDLDAQNYLQVITTAQDAYNAGVEDLIVDMSELKFMASSGLVALHSIALIMQGTQPPDPEHGWEAFHSIQRDVKNRKQEHIVLVNPQPLVYKTLVKSGFSELFNIFEDINSAIDSLT